VSVLCSTEDVKKRLGGRDLTTEEGSAFEGLAEEATALIEGYLEHTFSGPDADDDGVPDDAPQNVRVVASRMIARTFGTSGTPGGVLGGTMLPGTRSFNSSMGPMGHTTTFGDDVVFGSPWLSRADKLMLRKPKKFVEHLPMYPEREARNPGFDFSAHWDSP